MKYFFLLFIPIYTQAQIWTDTLYKEKIQFYGEWTHMDNPPQYGSFPKADSCYAQYKFWGFGIDIYTERFDGHKYYIVEIDGERDTVDLTRGPRMQDYRTYFNHRLDYGNHTLKIYGPRYGYVINKLVKYVDSVPTEKPCMDTILVEEIIFRDSIILVKEIIWDTVTVTKIDTILVEEIVTDTVLVEACDTVKIIVEKPIEGDCKEPIWKNILLVVMGSIATIFIVLYIVQYVWYKK